MFEQLTAAADAPRVEVSRAPPEFLRRTQPPAQFALCDNGRLMVTVGELTLVLTPEDIRRLDRFMGLFAASEETPR